MKIKKKEYKRRLTEAYEAGIRYALEEPENAKMYIGFYSVRDTLKSAAEGLKKMFEDKGI